MLTFPIQFIKLSTTLTQYHEKKKKIDKLMNIDINLNCNSISKFSNNNNTITNCDLEYKDGSIAGKLFM